MLSSIYLGKNAGAGRKVDLHRHALFSCAWSRLMRRLARLWS
jgi:hypothetical protein